MESDDQRRRTIRRTRGAHVGEAGLNSHQRDTVAQIFRHPTSHNIEWHDVMSLLNAIGTVRETHKGHMEVTAEDVVEVFEPKGHKEVDADQLAILRRLLRKLGWGPEGDSV